MQTTLQKVVMVKAKGYEIFFEGNILDLSRFAWMSITEDGNGLLGLFSYAK